MSSLKAIVNQEHLWTALREELEKRLFIQQTNLEGFTGVEDIYRAQGQVKALRSLLKLREKVNGKE